MKKTAPLLLALSFSAPFTAMADVVLHIPDNVDILAVNAHKPEQSSGLFGSNKETMKNGVNQIVFKYSPTFQTGSNDSRERAYSDVIIAKFDAKDTELNFKLPKYRSLTQAREEIGDLKWSLTDEDGKNVVIAQDLLKKNGIQFGRDYVSEIQDYNAGLGAAALTTGAVKAQVASTATPATTSSTKTTQSKTSQTKAAVDTSNVTQLKLWYQKSTPAERKAFRKWIIDQE